MEWQRRGGRLHAISITPCVTHPVAIKLNRSVDFFSESTRKLDAGIAELLLDKDRKANPKTRGQVSLQSNSAPPLHFDKKGYIVLCRSERGADVSPTDRPSAGYAGPPYFENACRWPAPWVGCIRAGSTDVQRRPSDSTRVALSRLANARDGDSYCAWRNST